MSKPVCYVTRLANNPVDDHGAPCCPHNVTGPAVDGSPNVFVHGEKALRIGDPGVHSTCCDANTWKAAEGSGTVFVNGIPFTRLGDGTSHCGGPGKMVTGSESVFAG